VEATPWQLAGPFNHPEGPLGIGTPHPPETLLKQMRPGETLDLSELKYEGKGGSILSWMPATTPKLPKESHPLDSGFINLANQPSNPQGIKGWSEKIATYLYRTVTLKKSGPVLVTMGSDDSLRFWVNGELVLDRNVARGTDVAADLVYLSLGEGVNHLLAKVVNGGGAAGFAMRKWKKPPQNDIDASIDKGVDYLLAQQLIDGSWAERQGAYRNGSTSLALYALMKSGLPSKHPAVQKGLAFLRAEPAVKTYSLGCQMLAVAETKEPAFLPWLEEMAADMGSWQLRGGMWSYPEGNPDLSCTQYAAFGLRAAASRGVKVPDFLWERLAQGVLKYQEKRNLSSAGPPAAGFSYRNHLPLAPTGSMTTAGIAVLQICAEALGGEMDSNLAERVHRGIDMGTVWLSNQFSVSKNPWKGWGHYYFLYGLERAGSLLNLKNFGKHDWYWEAAGFLLEHQGGSGDWFDRPSSAHQGPEITTCFSLLFLNRATQGPTTRQKESSRPGTGKSDPNKGPVQLVATSGPPATFWLESPGTTSAIDRVEYRVRLQDGGEWGFIGEVRPDSESLGGDRFPIQHLFEFPGIWEVRASVFLPGGTRLESGPAVLEAREGVAPHQLRYSDDAVRNLLARRNPVVGASSSKRNFPAKNLVDNTAYRSWVCDPTDKDPWFQVATSSSVKVDRILLTHARTRKSRQKDNPRPSKIEVFLNRDTTPMVVNVLTDYREKTVIVLDKTRRINRCRVRILEVVGGEIGKHQIGFAEIEFQAGPVD